MFNLINLFNIVRLKFNLYKLKFLNLLIKKPQISGYKIIFKMDDLNSYSNAIIKLDKIIDKENIKVSIIKHTMISIIMLGFLLMSSFIENEISIRLLRLGIKYIV